MLYFIEKLITISIIIFFGYAIWALSADLWHGGYPIGGFKDGLGIAFISPLIGCVLPILLIQIKRESLYGVLSTMALGPLLGWINVALVFYIAVQIHQRLDLQHDVDILNIVSIPIAILWFYFWIPAVRYILKDGQNPRGDIKPDSSNPVDI